MGNSISSAETVSLITDKRNRSIKHQALKEESGHRPPATESRAENSVLSAVIPGPRTRQEGPRRPPGKTEGTAPKHPILCP